jgi:hypothetical protein
MKTRYLVMGTVFLVGVLAASAAVAITCYELRWKACLTRISCASYCTPNCGSVVAVAPYSVEKCCEVPTGHYECNKGSYIACYLRHLCETSTITCPSDALEKKCKGTTVGSVTISNWKKRTLSGSGCS